MKYESLYRIHFRQWLLGAVTLAFAPAMWAQGSSSSPPKSPNAPSTPPGLIDLPTQQKTFAGAKASVAAGNLASAEAALESLNVAPAGTPEWDYETSQRLMHLADDLARSGNSASVASIANLALQHLSKARGANVDLYLEANSWAAAGQIELKALGDPDSAIADYQEAVKLQPGNAALADTLQQLEEAEVKLEAKVHPPKKS